ncbi:COQ9 family protein [Sabulicella glaciei]|uniref:COQ9 family protein n=1 Tax=Sabulicella glaciei TaxID=2984948 RepID=A0ABT3NU18_9PROT|nr:COQ9 family protein [Roseococcus sp. MDT2-1-1]MCW8085656.1 COQ9 family protein [Roseococcus sp. MDT2-1-1]
MTEPHLIRAAVAIANFDGWSEATLRAACEDSGEDPALLESHFPRGVTGAIEDWAALADAEMDQAASAEGIEALRVPQRIRRVVELRLRAAEPDKEALRGALRVLALPWNLGLAARITARTASTMWHAAGDSSADFSWYTRRATLAAIYTAMIAYWLSPRDPDIEQALAFLDRRLADIAPRRRAA